MRKGILKKEERSSRKATQEKLRIPQRELSLKCEFYLSLEMCFKNSYAVRLMSLVVHEPNASPSLSRAMGQARANLESSPDMLLFIIFEIHGHRKAVLKIGHSEGYPVKYNTLQLGYSYI